MLTVPEGTEVGGIDGLYFHRDGLLAIRGNSINRYDLNETRTAVVLELVLEMNHPLMSVPTTGVVVGDDFYYVANSQLDFVRPDGSLVTEKLTNPPILKLKLR